MTMTLMVLLVMRTMVVVSWDQLPIIQPPTIDDEVLFNHTRVYDWWHIGG